MTGAEQRMADERLSRWLVAEEAGRADEAEAAFSALFADRVPVLAPPLAFTGRVVDAVLARRTASPWTWLPVRLLGASAAVVMGLVLLALTLDPFLALQASARGTAALAADARAVLHAWLAMAASAWALAGTLGRTMLVASSSGFAPLILAANLLLALAASFGLARVLAPREECP